MPHLQSLLGIVFLISVAWLFSEKKQSFPFRIVIVGLLLQAAICILLLKVEIARNALFGLNGIVTVLTAATKAGTSFVYGFVGGSDFTPFTVTNPAAMTTFAFTILPLVIIISALSAILWYWRILPIIVGGMSFVLRHTLGIGGAVGLGSAATVFLGNIEGSLVVRPYLAKITRTELFILMTTGLAVVAGTVFVVYANMLGGGCVPNPPPGAHCVLPGALGHILVASMMSLPAAIIMASIMVPGDAVTDVSQTDDAHKYQSTMDAMARGTEDGLKIYMQILAMLIVVTAIVAIINTIMGYLPFVDGAPLTLQRVLGWIFAPLVWLYGVPWNEAVQAGSLLGVKTILNEFVAYSQLVALPPNTFDQRTTMIMVYSLCGFANFTSVGILIAGFGTLVPERRSEIVPLAMRAIVSGTMASGLSGAMIGLLT
ncbi:MAG: nucleoside:proton symporter [Alphaproteobacteria bacterium]|nr:nucleoside:proton symporter [Alphaproteobacteria bacterium]MBV9542687.1 nucleoside:proton symporter [Alphaproteobacteria bacterium]MBV9904582.1 nucleoside:proton symporter [Alphaproteobacteria bacterium]